MKRKVRRTGLVTAIFGVSILCALVGCSPDDRRNLDYGIIGGLQPDSVLVTVNGESYRYRDLCADVGFRFTLFTRNRRKPLDEKSAKRMKVDMAKRILPQIIDAKLVEKTLGGIPADEKERQKVEARYVARFRKKGESAEDFHAWLEAGGWTRDFNDMISKEARLNTGLRERFPEELSVTDKQVTDWKAKIERCNARADATNALVYALATNICKRARTGEDFAALARTYSQADERDKGGDLGEIGSGFFTEDESEVWDMVNALREGEVSDPIPTEDGLAIFKSFGHVAKSADTEKPAVRLSRICLHRMLKYPDYDENEIRKTLARIGREEAFEKLVQPLRDVTVVTFPSGTRYFPKKIIDLYQKKGPSK